MSKNRGLESRRVVESFADQTLTKDDFIATETPIAFAFNGISHAIMMATPSDMEDYALGFSLTERVIDSVDDVLNMEIRETRRGIAINLHILPDLTARLERQRRQFSGRSSCGVCGISDLAAAIPKLAALSPCPLPNHETIERALELFKNSSTIQQQSGATHSAAIFDEAGSLLLVREDIGRHNALDKLIGAISKHPSKHIREGERRFVLLSSRASHELITKAVIAKVGSLVTISAATTLAIDMSKELKLNLVGFLRDGRQIIYTDASSQN